MRLFTLLTKFTLLVAVITATFQANAQDLHFSQYESQTSLVNPGLVGNYDGSYRISAIFRSQWASALGQDGYQTVGADVDFCLLEGYLKGDKLAIGVGFFNDRSGAAAYDNTSANLTVAYHKILGKNGNHRLSLGLQAAYLQSSISNPLFADQFNGFNETNNLTSKEIFSHNVYRFDFNAGLYYRGNFSDRVKLGLGLGVYHLTSPNQSLVTSQLTGLSSSILPRRYDADVNLEIFVDAHKKWSLTPSLLFMYQTPFAEYLPGVAATYYFNTGFRNNNSISIGIRYRSGGSTPDAVIPTVNMQFRNVKLGFSYDANVSGLSTSTNNRGAFELSLLYVGETIKSYKANQSLPSRRY